MDNQFDELQNDEFESELEKEKKSHTLSLYLLLIIGTIGLSFFLYTFIQSSMQVKTPNTSSKIVPQSSVETKKFKIEPLPSEAKSILEKKPILPPIPKVVDIVKEKILKKIRPLKPKVIKSTSTSMLRFNKIKIPETNQSKHASTKTKNTHTSTQVETVSAYHGGISNTAGINRYDPDLYLARGTYIECSLKTKLISAVSGQIACTVSNNIYSVSGNVLLVDKGSTIVGKYQSGKLKFGMERHYVIWDEIRTPNNVMINVSSGATDTLGAGGMKGDVEYHWGLRLGAALLVSLIDTSLNAVSSNLEKQNNTNANYFVSPRYQTQNMAEEILNQFINIPAVLYKNQGDTVGVYVNKDIDFSKVYRLRRKGQQ